MHRVSLNFICLKVENSAGDAAAFLFPSVFRYSMYSFNYVCMDIYVHSYLYSLSHILFLPPLYSLSSDQRKVLLAYVNTIYYQKKKGPSLPMGEDSHASPCFVEGGLRLTVVKCFVVCYTWNQRKLPSTKGTPLK